jgi:uncharacterized protein YndB with AHSA1/START domain
MEKIILIKDELECDIRLAFNMFTDSKSLEKWLTEKAEVDPEVGGKYELYWEPKKKEINSTIGCRITGFEEDKFISFNWKGPVQFKDFMNSADPLTHVIVFFTQSRNNPKKTTIYLFHTGWRKDPKWQKAREYFEKAWTNALKGLQEKIKNKSLF